MSTTTARKWVLKSHFSGLPKREDLEIVEEKLPPIKDGGRQVERHGHTLADLFPFSASLSSSLYAEFLCEAQWWTVDPYMR